MNKTSGSVIGYRYFPKPETNNRRRIKLTIVCLGIAIILWMLADVCQGQVIVCEQVVRGQTYVLRLNSDGTASLTAVTAVVTPGGTPGPKPPPDPAPSALRTIARDATRAVQDPDKATNGPRIAAVYRALAMFADQMTSAAGANELLNRLLDASIGSDVKALWRPVAVAVAGAMPTFSSAAYRAAYTSIAEGIEDGLGMARAGDGQPGYISDRFWEFLLALLKILIPLLFPPGQDLGMIDAHGGEFQSSGHELSSLMPPHRFDAEGRLGSHGAADRPGSPRTGGSQLISIPSLSGSQEGQATVDTPSLRDGAPGGSARTKPPVRFNNNPALIRMFLDMQEAENRRDAQPSNTQRISLIDDEWRPIAIAPRRSAAACAT